jgi:hypothetical protein
MRQMLFVAIAWIAFLSSAAAQDAVTVDPKHYKVEFENDQVRVLRLTYGPHEKSVMHEHPPHLTVSSRMLTLDSLGPTARPWRPSRRPDPPNSMGGLASTLAFRGFAPRRIGLSLSLTGVTTAERSRAGYAKVPSWATRRAGSSLLRASAPGCAERDQAY